MTASRARAAAAVALLLALPAAGCRDDLTQVVLVIESDLMVSNDVDGVDVTATAGSFAPIVQPFFTGSSLPPSFPVSVGFDSSGATVDFSFVVRFFHGVFTALPPGAQGPLLVISRTVTDVRFVDQKTMMLVLPLVRACACSGSTCPSPGDPACDNIDKPALQPFDPAVAPPSTMMQVSGGGGGGIFN